MFPGFQPLTFLILLFELMRADRTGKGGQRSEDMSWRVANTNADVRRLPILLRVGWWWYLCCSMYSPLLRNQGIQDINIGDLTLRAPIG